MLNGLIHQEDSLVLNVHAPNNTQNKHQEFSGEIEKSIVISRSLLAPLCYLKTSRHEINKDTEVLNKSFRQINLVFIEHSTQNFFSSIHEILRLNMGQNKSKCI